MTFRLGFVKQNKEIGKVAGGGTFKHVIRFLSIGNRGHVAHWAVKPFATVFNGPREAVSNVITAIGAGLHQVTLTPAKAYHWIVKVLYTHSSIIPQITYFRVANIRTKGTRL